MTRCPRRPAEHGGADVLRGTRDKGPEYANNSGWRVQQLVEAVDGVLIREKPEMAIIMIGTNDITGNSVPADYRSTARACRGEMSGCRLHSARQHHPAASRP